MTDSRINLKALNRAEGPVQRFRALRATVAFYTPPPIPHEIIHVRPSRLFSFFQNPRFCQNPLRHPRWCIVKVLSWARQVVAPYFTFQ